MTAVPETEASAWPERMRRRHLCLDDFERAARRRLPAMLYGFIKEGAERNASVHGNRAAFDAVDFVPRVLGDTSGRSTVTTLFGRDYAQPFGIAPMGACAFAAYRGDLALARAAAGAGVPMIVSAASLIRLEDIRAACPLAWFQAYLPGEQERIEPMVARVAAAGFETLVLTVDIPVPANREHNTRNGFATPLRPTPRLAWQGVTRPRWLLGTLLRTLAQHGMPHFENMDATRGPPFLSRNATRALGRRDALSWDDVALIRRRWPGRFILKGILSPLDARLAREHGVDGVVVSNHGGRQLDGAVAPLRVLPAIRAEAGTMAVLLDGGIRRGTDVLKALALGADFVLLGRPFLYAAALGGEAGVRHAIAVLGEEIGRNMALLGVTSPAAVGADHVMRPG